MSDTAESNRFIFEKQMIEKCFDLAKALDDHGFPAAALLVVMGAYEIAGAEPDSGEEAPVRSTKRVRRRAVRKPDTGEVQPHVAVRLAG